MLFSCAFLVNGKAFVYCGLGNETLVTLHLKLTGPKYIINGTTVQFKGDTNLLNISEDVYFYEDVVGYLGSDSTDWAGNAHYNISFASRGETDISAVVKKGILGDVCSYQTSYVQSAPTITTITKNIYYSGNRLLGDLSAYGTIDNSFSKHGQLGPGVSYIWEKKHIALWDGRRCDVNEEVAVWETIANSNSETLTVDQYACDTRFRVKSYDGTFYSDYSQTFIVGK
mgnify:CR=1 FL=1